MMDIKWSILVFSSSIKYQTNNTIIWTKYIVIISIIWWYVFGYSSVRLKKCVFVFVSVCLKSIEILTNLPLFSRRMMNCQLLFSFVLLFVLHYYDYSFFVLQVAWLVSLMKLANSQKENIWSRLKEGFKCNCLSYALAQNIYRRSCSWNIWIFFFLGRSFQVFLRTW